MDSPVDKMAYWLIDQQLRADQRAVLACLTHLSVDRASRASSFPIGETLTDASANMLAARIYQHAVDHAAAFQGLPQQYAVELWWPADGTAGATHMIRVLGAMAPAGNPTEPASERGALAQTMRHMEAREKLNAHVLQSAFGHLATVNTQLLARNETLERERATFMDVFERASSNLHVRELETLRETRKQARIDGAAESLKLIAGPIVSGVLAKAGIGGAAQASVNDAVCASWLRTLTRAQFDSMLAQQSPEQQIALITIYQKLVLAHEPDPAPTPTAPNNGSTH